jgi:hypothetical protein
MKSKIEVVTVLRTADPAFQFSKKVSSMIGVWSEGSLKVTPKVLTGLWPSLLVKSIKEALQ